VYEYYKRFIYLAQYGSHHIDMDAKKTTLFCKGLCAKIREHLMPFPELDLQPTHECHHLADGCHLCHEGKSEEQQGPSRTFWGCSTQVPPSLHSACRPTMQFSSTIAVGLPYTSAGSFASAGSPVAVCSTSTSAGCRVGLPMLQLWVPWALCSGLSPATTGLVPESPATTWESADEAPSHCYPKDWQCQLHHD
jgi:hypothetical protein